MISVQSLTKYFNRGSVNEVLSLDNISLTVEQGDFVAIIGSNGAGKSTFLNCVAGSHIPDQGKLLLNDIDMTLWPEHKRARYLHLKNCLRLYRK